MSGLTKNLLLSLLLISSNGGLGWLINQLPTKSELKLSDSTILGLTIGCIFFQVILTFISSDSQQQSSTSTATSNQSTSNNWIGGFLPLLGGGILSIFLYLKLVPTEFSLITSYASLIMFALGAILPPVLILPEKWRKWLLWLIPGFGIFLTVHLILKQQQFPAVVSLILTGIITVILAAKDFFKIFITELSVVWEEYQRQGAVSAATWIKDKFEDVISPFQRDYYKALEYKCRDFETQGLDNEWTLELKNVFVQLKISANSANNARQDIIPQSLNQNSEKSIWDFLAANKSGENQFKKIVILGRPGSGKTTLLRHLTLIYATKQETKINPRPPQLIPILFYLREIRDEIANHHPSLEDLIKQHLEKLKINNKPLKTPIYWLQKNLYKNRFLILLDGLDEVADKNQRQQVRTWVDRQMEAYPDTIFILTSRPNGYRELQRQVSVNELEVQPFNRGQIEEFLHSWYLQTEIKSRAGQSDEGVKQAAKEQANKLINRIQDSQNSRAIAAMAVNPLLLTMIATVHRRGNVLPGKRVELYKEICQILLEKRQRAKNIPDALTASQKQSFLQELALKLMQKEVREFNLAEGVGYIQQQLTTLPQHFANAEAFIRHIRDDCGLLVEKENDIYEFAHLSFQEYLAAVEIKESNQEDILIRNINNSWWAETIRLYATVNDATNLIRAVINMPVPSINAFLVVADYEEEGWRIDNQVRQQISEKLDAGLESDDSEIFKLAAGVKLAKRLNNLVRVDENAEVDNSCVTCAEYKLFLLENGHNPQQNLLTQSFVKGTAKNIVDDITLEDANRFCVWLSLKDTSNQLDKLATWYRLPTLKERKQYNIPEENKTKIRLVRCKLPLKYSQLAKYLMRGEWREADEETFKVMLQVAGRENQGYLDIEAIDNFPCEDLRIIDTLWVSASNGHFGFSVQKEIYQSLGGKREYNEKVWNAFCDRVGWKIGGSWLRYDDYTFNLNAPKRDTFLPLPLCDNAPAPVGKLFSSLAQKLVNCNI
ncbi:GUN4 domain-containing protein [Calothrix sp. PCC 6303]|uniref:GUN4 domain-containing protein n=1 Tax=Calothrix sp. PCC 6303 TaxID=1170562 RepID=UPI0002A01A31|nr:GUN4 domain-containing protein [Calothrix sp. PCC 6303]AFZ03095.1 putative signal transduction protein with Nacht domain [Calothrix sp. PCC 6303]